MLNNDNNSFLPYPHTCNEDQFKYLLFLQDTVCGVLEFWEGVESDQCLQLSSTGLFQSAFFSPIYFTFYKFQDLKKKKEEISKKKKCFKAIQMMHAKTLYGIQLVRDFYYLPSIIIKNQPCFHSQESRIVIEERSICFEIRKASAWVLYQSGFARETEPIRWKYLHLYLYVCLSLFIYYNEMAHIIREAEES